MNKAKRLLNLVWKVPLVVIIGSMCYPLVKAFVVELLTTGGGDAYLKGTEIVMLSNLVPLAIPVCGLVWAFWDFIVPPKEDEFKIRG